MIERLLGGVGSEYDLSRDFTDIEKAILQYVLKKITEFLGEAWGQYLDIEASLTGLQTNPHLLQMSAQEDVVIQVELEVVIEKLRARINMVMPAPNVEELTSKFCYSFAVSHKKQDDDKQKSKRHYIEPVSYTHLSRKKGESIKIGDDIEIFVSEIKGDKVRLGISAPGDMKICRTELYLTMENNKEASDKVDLLKVFQLSRNLKALAQEDEKEVREEKNGSA